MEMLKKLWRDPVLSKVIAAGIVAVIGYLLQKWGLFSLLWEFLGSLIQLANSHVTNSLLIIFIVVTILLWRRVVNISRHVAITFKDNFRRNDLKERWDYEGPWQIIRRGELHVTQSDIGGITKVGQLWKDYRFEFDALIVNDRIGWIVRAQDLFNYYMIQLTPEAVRPHLRIGGQWIVLSERPHSLKIKSNQWMHIVTEVRGYEARVYVDQQEVYSDANLFSMKFFRITQQQGKDVVTPSPTLQANTIIVPIFTTGRVGFRMHGLEEGRIRKCRVKPIS